MHLRSPRLSRSDPRDSIIGLLCHIDQLVAGTVGSSRACHERNCRTPDIQSKRRGMDAEVRAPVL